MKLITRLTFVGFSLILSVCLLVNPALAQLGMDTLTGLWLFDEGSGDVAVDSSNSVLDAALVGDPVWVSGVFGSGLELKGFLVIYHSTQPTGTFTFYY